MKNEELAFPSAAERCFLTLNSICCIALCEPAAKELKSKNAHGFHRCTRSLFTDPFFDLSFDFRFDFDCTLTGQGGF